MMWICRGRTKVSYIIPTFPLVGLITKRIRSMEYLGYGRGYLLVRGLEFILYLLQGYEFDYESQLKFKT